MNCANNARKGLVSGAAETNGREFLRRICFHCCVMARGFARMMVGTGTAGMLALSVYGYAMIPEEGGYVAVSEFLIATALLATAIGCLYAMGAGKKKGAKK